MALAHCPVFSLLLPSNNSITNTRRTFPLLVVSSIPISNPSRVTLRRKNHLRHKILETLTKSYPSFTPLPQQESRLSLPSTTEVDDDSRVEVPADGVPSENVADAAVGGGGLEELPDSVPSGSIAAAAVESGELEELLASASTGTMGEFNGISGKLPAKSILKDGIPSESVADAAGEGGGLEESPVSVPSGSISAAAVESVGNISKELSPTESGELEELPASESTGTMGEFNGMSGLLSAKSILKDGSILFGAFVWAFVLQAIFAFMIMHDDESDQEAGDSDVSEKRNVLFDESEKSMRVTIGNGVISLKDRPEMDKKIEEIKLMAREARRIEGDKEEEEIGDHGSDDESAVSGYKNEKEIDERSLNLQDRVNSDTDKSALLNVIKNLGTSVKSTGGVVKDNKNMNKGNGSLMFKKKFKFKSPSTKPRKAPKGFSGTRDHTTSDAETRHLSSKDWDKAQENRSTAIDHEQILHEDKHVNQLDDEAQETDSRLSLEDGGKLVDEEANTLQNTGKNLEELMAQSNEATGARVKNKRSDGGFGEDAKTNFEKGDNLQRINGNGISKDGIADNTSAARNVKVKQGNTEADMWWLKLRYVLVIIMRSDSDEEGPSGLYSLKMASQEEDQNEHSYIVAFEDNVDADNFCYLLESFFEDLDDFSAVSVPMPIKELQQAVKSQAKKVVVVKKRQIQLYVGQPLSDVENSLRSLVEQSQNVRPADSK